MQLCYVTTQARGTAHLRAHLNLKVNFLNVNNAWAKLHRPTPAPACSSWFTKSYDIVIGFTLAFSDKSLRLKEVTLQGRRTQVSMPRHASSLHSTTPPRVVLQEKGDPSSTSLALSFKAEA
jgi:hypothetical protein